MQIVSSSVPFHRFEVALSSLPDGAPPSLGSIYSVVDPSGRALGKVMVVNYTASSELCCMIPICEHIDLDHLDDLRGDALACYQYGALVDIRRHQNDAFRMEIVLDMGGNMLRLESAEPLPDVAAVCGAIMAVQS